MKNINEKNYPNIKDAVAFDIAFDPWITGYPDRMGKSYYEILCDECEAYVQIKDYEAQNIGSKADYGLFDLTLEFAVKDNLRQLLIENFDITEDDFRPMYTRRGKLIYYQITPKHTMLPIGHVNGWTPQEPCPCCGRVQYNFNDFSNENDEDYHYITKEALEDMHDINVSFEKFRFYRPNFVVSRRVYDFLSVRYPRMRFEPYFLAE
jgi:hypothetical protein